MTALRGRGLQLACLALGVATLAVTVWAVGLDALVRDLRLIGWGLLAILLVESLGVALNTGAWMLAFPRGERSVGVPRLLAARLAGDAINYLTPSASVGGELLRVRLLAPEVPASVRWASVSVAKVGQSVAQVVFIFLGLALAWPRLASLGPGLRGLAAAMTAGAGVVAIGAAGAFVWAVGRGFWTTVRGAIERLGLGRLLPASWTGPGENLDAALARLGSRRLVASLACFVLGWAVGAAEIYLILRWTGAAVDWPTVLALETGSVLLDGMLFFVPAKVGTQEGSKVLLFAVLGLDPARGLTVGIVRRIRELTYAGLGLLALAWLSARAGVAVAPGLRTDGSPGDRAPRRA